MCCENGNDMTILFVLSLLTNCLFCRFMSDQEAWHELCNLYLTECDYGKAAFCMEELLLHNPHSHLIHQRLAEIRYTMVIIIKSNRIAFHSNYHQIYVYYLGRH